MVRGRPALTPSGYLDGKRIVRWYSNRRLYDTVATAYINQAEILRLIDTGENVVVMNARTSSDVTSHVMRQILCSEELGLNVSVDDVRRALREAQATR